jgi:hypothetical protein
LLNKEEHGHLGLSRPERPFDFVKSVRGVPLVSGEVQTAQKFYPVVFSEFEDPTLIAVVGVTEDSNLFVDENGNWDRGAYIPSYLRCHPFAFARRPDDQYAVVIDKASRAITESPEVPFFDGDNMSEDIQARVDFCGQYDAERQATKVFCEKVKELGLLTGQRVTQSTSDGAESKVADYVTIDPRKLTELDKDSLQELHQNGMLSVMFAQLFSLENWNRLITRRAEAQMNA